MTHPIRAILVSALLLAVLPVRAAQLTTDQQAVHVLNRLAYGPKPGDIERVRQMGVQRYIDSQLNPESIPFPAELSERLKGLTAANQNAGQAVLEFTELNKQVKDDDEGAKKKRRVELTRMALETAQARLLRAIDSPRQLEEVMVDFWFNHFNVYSNKGIDRALLASYERDAIRPYVLGSFRDMLGATAKHPAMLYYLDNFLSTSNGYQPVTSLRRKPTFARNGPKAKARGLNENFAREVMELHTLGVDGGYTQKDVTELARMLTGWSYDNRALVRDNHTFDFDAARHDHGVKMWMGREVTDHGQGEGEFALDVLALHPSTAHHISYKLAQYFVQDNPPAALVERMAHTWQVSKGDIRSVLRTLFASDEFMAQASFGAKFKTPYQFVVSAARASATPVVNVAPLLATMTQLGMPLYGCQTPDGYKNTQDAWLNPDALTRRIGFATALAAGRLALAGAPAAPAAPAMAAAPSMSAAPGMAATAPALAAVMPALDATQLQATLGPAISPRTLDTIANSPEALRAAMLLGGPDFMQR